MTTPKGDLSKVSDKVLAKFARRSATMRMVLLASGCCDTASIDEACYQVREELTRRGVKWDSSASE